MFFWKKQKKVVLRCFTSRDGLVDLFPPTRMPKVVPDWWKKTPALVDMSEAHQMGSHAPSKLQKTVKHCYAVQKLFENGIALPSWHDAFIGIDAKGMPRGHFPDMSAKNGDHHPPQQYPGMVTPSWVNYKLVSPWLFYTEEPIHFYMANPFYHIQDHNWQTMPGVVEFHYQHHTNVNMIFKRPNMSSGVEYEFRAGDILAYFLPMTERDIEVQVEQVTEAEMKRLDFDQKIWFSHAKAKRDLDIGGCPFHRK